MVLGFFKIPRDIKEDSLFTRVDHHQPWKNLRRASANARRQEWKMITAMERGRPSLYNAASNIRGSTFSVCDWPYKFWMTLVVCVLLILQRTVGTYADTLEKTLLGHVFSLGLCVAVMELGRPTIGTLLLKRVAITNRMPPILVHLSLAAAMLGVAFSGKLAPLFALRGSAPPTLPLVILITFWGVMLVAVARHGFSLTKLALYVAGMAFGSGVIVMSTWPFDKLDGDMLATIKRSLLELDAGRFPYVNHPPPMPYPPATFLAYWPAHALGLDLRCINLLLTIATVFTTTYLADVLRRRAKDARGCHEARVEVNQFVLPFLMLHPIWMQFSVNSQYSPTILVSVLLGFAVLLEIGLAQAILLGVAVASNQMLGAFAPVLFAYWVGRTGLPRATWLGVISASVFLTIIAPFLIWDSQSFLDTILASRNQFSDELMAGRFTLLPAGSKILPHADLVGVMAALVVAAWVAFRARQPATTVACMGSGLCVALMFQPVSFAHYFLPAIALASITPGSHSCRSVDISIPPAMPTVSRRRSTPVRRGRRAGVLRAC